MNDKALDRLLGDLDALQEQGFEGPFPYADCKKLIGRNNEAYEDLTADLNTYFSEIIGSSTWGRRITKWPEERMYRVRRVLDKTFFERYPEYLPLEGMITKSDTPDLYKRLILSEQMRVIILDILTLLLSKN